MKATETMWNQKVTRLNGEVYEYIVDTEYVDDILSRASHFRACGEDITITEDFDPCTNSTTKYTIHRKGKRGTCIHEYTPIH